MALFRRRRAVMPEPVEEQRSTIWPGYPGLDFALSSMPGVSVTDRSALRNVAVWGCQRVLVATVSGFPVDQFRLSNGRKSEVTAQSPIVRNPSGNPSIRRRAWVAQCIRSMVSSGNIYGDVVAVDSMGRPTQIEIIDPAIVSWHSTPEGVRPHVDGKARTVWPLGDLWHVPASQFMTGGQCWALSPTEHAKTAISTGIAAEEFGSRFFSDGAHPTHVLKVDGDPTVDQVEDVKRRLMQISRGNREPLVIGDAWTFEKLQVDPKDSQFLELLRFEIEQACRIYGVRPSRVFAAVSGQNITYSNITDDDIQFLKYDVTPWLVDLEEAWSELIAPPEFVRFNTDALLRMSPAERWGLHIKRLEAKTTTVNEVRHLEDETSFTDSEFDRPGIPVTDNAPIIQV